MKPTAHGQILIDDEPLQSDEIRSTLPLFGFRTITPNLIYYSKADAKLAQMVNSWDELDGLLPDARAGKIRMGMPVQHVMVAFTSYTKIHGEPTSFETIPKDLRGTRAKIISMQLPSLMRAVEYKPILVQDYIWGEDITKYSAVYDAGVLTNLASAGLYDVRGKKFNFFTLESMLKGKLVDYVEVNPILLREIKDIYSQKNIAEKATPDTQSSEIAKSFLVSSRYPLVDDAIRYRGGEVSFGYTHAYHYTEKKLKIEKSILNRFDIYWVDFVFTIRNIIEKNVESVTLNIEAPDSFVALEMIPLLVTETTIKKRKLATPSVTAGSISIGTVFEQEISYESLEPTIVASGLRENKFSWDFSENAILQGSKKMTAIMGVPRDSKILPFQIIVTVKLTSATRIITGSGPLSEFISTLPYIEEVSLNKGANN